MFYANIGNGFVELDVKSELQINLKNDQSLVVIDATGSITILGLKCFQLSAYYKKNSINFEGNCTIIDWSCFDVSGHLKGSLSPNGTFLLTGTGSINFLGYEFSGCDFLIANSIMSLSTTWLGQSLRRAGSRGDGNIQPVERGQHA